MNRREESTHHHRHHPLFDFSSGSEKKNHHQPVRRQPIASILTASSCAKSTVCHITVAPGSQFVLRRRRSPDQPASQPASQPLSSATRILVAFRTRKNEQRRMEGRAEEAVTPLEEEDDTAPPASATATSCLHLPPPRNPLVCAMLTDLYQITMVYAYWKNNRHNDNAVFELFFRKNPFGGQYTIFAGLEECLKYLTHLSFTSDDIHYLRNDVPSLQHCDEAFWDYLTSLDASHVELYALPEGSVAFPRVPLLIVQAPLAIGQLLETTLLTLINYPSLVATNAARMVDAANAKRIPPSSSSSSSSSLPAQCSRIPVCVEFGLRRAQGPDGGFSASQYAHLGGFVATSNVLAGQLSHVPLSGTHAHAFVQSFANLEEVKDATLPSIATTTTTTATNSDHEPSHVVLLLPLVLERRQELVNQYDADIAHTHNGELAAFVAYATAFPQSFLGLIDTYDTLKSGLFNFVVVATILMDLGYTPLGIRLDSGNLAELSMTCAKFFQRLSNRWPALAGLSIVASNDLNEAALHNLNETYHAITAYGIGTNLVTCEAQPALGCVYKLVELNGIPRLKLSQDPGKATIPSHKRAYRLYGGGGPDGTTKPLLDLLMGHDEPPPEPGQRVLCLHPADDRKRVVAIPSRVVPLHIHAFHNGHPQSATLRSLSQARQACAKALATFPDEVTRFKNPCPYKVSLTPHLFQTAHDLWLQESPVPELS